MHLDLGRSKNVCLTSQHETKEKKKGQGLYWADGNLRVPRTALFRANSGRVPVNFIHKANGRRVGSEVWGSSSTAGCKWNKILSFLHVQDVLCHINANTDVSYFSFWCLVKCCAEDCSYNLCGGGVCVFFPNVFHFFLQTILCSSRQCMSKHYNSYTYSVTQHTKFLLSKLCCIRGHKGLSSECTELFRKQPGNPA